MMSKTPEYPRLDELIERAGGYDKITPAMWADYDRRVERWQADYREEIRSEQGRKR